MKIVLIPIMLVIAGLFMSFAWIGHLKFRSFSFLMALVMSGVWFARVYFECLFDPLRRVLFRLHKYPQCTSHQVSYAFY